MRFIVIIAAMLVASVAWGQPNTAVNWRNSAVEGTTAVTSGALGCGDKWYFLFEDDTTNSSILNVNCAQGARLSFSEDDTDGASTTGTVQIRRCIGNVRANCTDNTSQVVLNVTLTGDYAANLGAVWVGSGMYWVDVIVSPGDACVVEAVGGG